MRLTWIIHCHEVTKKNRTLITLIGLIFTDFRDVVFISADQSNQSNLRSIVFVFVPSYLRGNIHE